MSELKVNKISPQSGTAFTLGDSGDTFTVPSGATLTVSGTLTQTGAQTFDGGVDIDNFNINGTTIALSSGNMTIDAQGNDTDIIFKGTDGSADTTFLTIDGSAAGAATFNGAITSGAVITSGAGLVIADAGNIGSASDTDAIAIAANGVVTFSQGITSTAASNTFGASSFNDANITNVGTIAADRILGDGDTDSYVDFPGSDVVTINTGDNIRFRIDDSGKLSSGGETAPDVSKGGITLNQAQFDTAIFTLKSSDIAHGMTAHYETDTYLALQKKSAGDGGVLAVAMCEGDQAWRINAYVNNDNTTQNATGNGAFHLQASKKTSNDVTTMGANANLMVVSNNGATRFIVDEDGDILYDGGASAYDAYDDAQLVRAFDMNRAPDAIIQSKFDKFVDYNYNDLKKTGILGKQSKEDDEAGKKPFIKMGALQRLHNGAIWQQYEKHQQLLEAVYELAKEAVGEEKANAILKKHEVKRLN